MGLLDPPPDRLPDHLRGLTLLAWGNSYSAFTGNSTAIYFEMLRNAFAGPFANLGVGGMLATDICSFAYGAFTAPCQGQSQFASQGGAQFGTFETTTAPAGLVIAECVGNDRGYDGVTTDSGTTAKSRAGFANALDAMIRLFRAVTRIDDTDGGWTYTGTWAHTTGINACSGQTASYTTTPGDKVSRTVTGTDFDLITLAIDNAGYGTPGAAWSLKVDGSVFATGTTSDQTRKTQSAHGDFGFGQMAIPIRGLTAGSHTIELSHTGASGQALFLDTLLVPSPTPPTVIVPKTNLLGAAGYATYVGLGGTTASRATDLVYNALIDTVVARFPSDRSVLTWDPQAAGFDPSDTIGNADGVSLHLNSKGNAFYFRGLYGLVTALPIRAGLVRV